MTDFDPKQYFNEEFTEPDPWNYETATYEQEKYERQIRTIRDYRPSPRSILELGCAEGIHSSMLLEAFPEATLTGVDISERAVERARDRVVTDRASFTVANIAEHVPTIDRRFDVVVWSETMYYLGYTLGTADMYDLVIDVANLLNPNGVLCSANIIDHDTGLESALTRRPIIRAYQEMFDAELRRVHDAEYTEYKSDRKHTYWIWGYRRD